MSAPTVERAGKASSRIATSPTSTPRNATSRRTESGAVGRAYARKAGRRRPTGEADRISAIGRSRFVLLVMGLLGSGLVASLWLSTSAAADSYRLDAATRATRDLSERSETLRTEIAAMRSAPALAKAARGLGMVPTSDVARLVAEPGGGVVVVGTPRAAYAPAPALAPAPVQIMPVVPGQPGAAPGTVPDGAARTGAGSVTDQQGVVPSRPLGAPPVQASQSAASQPSTAQRATQPSTSQPSTSQPSKPQPSTSQPATSRPSAQSGSHQADGSRP